MGGAVPSTTVDAAEEEPLVQGPGNRLSADVLPVILVIMVVLGIVAPLL